MASENSLPLTAIIDDEAPLRTATESLLRAHGFKAQEFSSAEEFLRSPSSAAMRCLILDITLPGMSGFDLQQHLVSNGSLIPIVFVTAHEDVDDAMRRRALHGGALAFLRKPFAGDELLRAVRHAYDLSGSQASASRSKCVSPAVED